MIRLFLFLFFLSTFNIVLNFILPPPYFRAIFCLNLWEETEGQREGGRGWRTPLGYDGCLPGHFDVLQHSLSTTFRRRAKTFYSSTFILGCMCVYVCVCAFDCAREMYNGAQWGFNTTPKTICTLYGDDKSGRRFEPRRGQTVDKSNFPFRQHPHPTHPTPTQTHTHTTHTA